MGWLIPILGLFLGSSLLYLGGAIVFFALYLVYFAAMILFGGSGWAIRTIAELLARRFKTQELNWLVAIGILVAANGMLARFVPGGETVGAMLMLGGGLLALLCKLAVIEAMKQENEDLEYRSVVILRTWRA